MEDEISIIQSILKYEENVKRYNAIIIIPNFGEHVSSDKYKNPNLLYYLDRHILLMVFWLDQLPSDKDLKNRDEFIEYLKKNPPIKCKMGGKELYVKSKYKNAYIIQDAEIRSVFMVPYEHNSVNKKMTNNTLEQIIYYRYNVFNLDRQNIHSNRMLIDDTNKIAEIEFVGDYNRYFTVVKIPVVVVANKYLMLRASLKDICTNKVSSYDPGVYALLYDGDIKKIGKAEAGICQRVSDYYFENRRNSCGGKAGGYINDINKDEIEVEWINCPKEQCADLEREVQMTVNYLGIQTEWDCKHEYNNKQWQNRNYEQHWKHMLNKIKDMGFLNEMVNDEIHKTETKKDVSLENSLNDIINENREIRKIMEYNLDCVKFLCTVVEDLEI